MCYRYQAAAFPIGDLTLIEKEGKLCRIDFGPTPSIQQAEPGESPLLALAAEQLSEYFAGKRRAFSVPLLMEGTPFQKKCWEALQQIPYGETRTYGDIARAIGHPNSFRAVGGANHRNPISIIVPCHRVIGSDKSLTGYGGGLPIKEFLLKLEGVL